MFIRILILLWAAARSTSGERNFGPLTTQFIPPSTCTLTTAYPANTADSIENPTGAGIAFADVEGLVDNPATACYPSNYGVSGGSTDYFSPGECPMGYTTGTHTTINDETRALCCPTDFTEGFYSPCEKRVYGTLTAQALLTRRGTGLEFYLGSTTSLFTSDRRTIYASGIAIRWRLSDRLTASPLPTSSSSSSPTSSHESASTRSSTEPPPSTSTGQGSPATPQQSDGLSVGASVGSILGAIFGALGVGVAIYYGWKMTKNRHPTEGTL